MFKDNNVVVFFASGIVRGPGYGYRSESETELDGDRFFTDLIRNEFGPRKDLGLVLGYYQLWSE